MGDCWKAFRKYEVGAAPGFVSVGWPHALAIDAILTPEGITLFSAMERKGC